MTAIKYLRLDYAMIKGYLRFYLLFPVIFLVFGIWSSPAFALNYLFFFVIIMGASPFSLESAEKSDKLYRMLPAKMNSMVMGRYLFLLFAIGFVVLIDTLAICYFYPAGKISTTEIVSLYFSCAVGSLLSFIQYPIYYKLGYEKGRISSMLIYMVPALLIFALPGIVEGILQESDIHSIIVMISRNAILLVTLIFVFIIIAGYVSYEISCRVVRKKEI